MKFGLSPSYRRSPRDSTRGGQDSTRANLAGPLSKRLTPAVQSPDEKDDEPETEEVQPRWGGKIDPSRAWLRWIVVILLAAIAGVFLARPVYRLFKDKRADAMLPAAETALDSGDLAEAGRLVRVLVGLSPRRPDVMRLTARYCSRVGNPDGLNYWNFLLATPEGTRDDRLAATEFALALNRLDVSLPHLRKMLDADPNDREALRLLTRHFQIAGDLIATRTSARHWLQAHPTDNEAEYVLGTVLLGAPDEATRSEGSRLLWGLTAGGSQWSEPAATALASKASLTRGESEMLLRRLSERPETHLAADRLRLRTHPEARDEIVAGVTRSVSQSSPLSELVPAVSWLAEAGALNEALGLLLPERALTNAPLLSVRLQILLEQKRFDEVQRTIDAASSLSNRVVLAPYVTACLNALKARQMKQDTDIGPMLDSALSAAGKDPRALAFVADYAEYLGGDRTALNAHIRRLDWSPGLLFSANQALRLARKLRDETAVHLAIRRLSEALPGDGGLKALEAYQAALLKVTPAQPREVLQELQRANPDDPLYRAALALVDLRAGRAIDALGVLELGTTDWKTADPRWHAVYVAALAANQQREAARVHARQINLESLSASERGLLEAAQ